MKKTLRLLSRFILMSLLLILLLSSLTVLFTYVIGYDPARASTTDLVAQFLAAIRECALVSILITAAISLFAVIRAAIRPFVPLVVLGTTWTVTIIVISALWLPLANDPGQPVPILPEGRIVRISGAAVYAPEVEGMRADPLVVHREGMHPGTELVQEAVIDNDSGQLLIRGLSAYELNLSDITSSYPAMVPIPEPVTPLLRDLHALNRLILPDSGQSQSILFPIALGLFLFACWTPARLTRWPLFNAVLVFLCIRGVLWLTWSIHYDELGRLLMSAVNEDRLELVSAGVLGFVAIVFLVVLFLMQPLSQLKRELGDE